MTSKKTEAKIRPMEPDDLDAVRALDRKITGKKRTPTYQDGVNEVFGGDMGLSFIAEADGEAVGLVLARIGLVPEQMSEVCLIQVLGVDPNYKGQGIARKLIQAVIEEAQTRRVRTVYVMVDQQDDQLKALFDHIGFSQGHLIYYTKDI